MTTIVDLSLPRTAPGVFKHRYREEAIIYQPVALYTFVKLDGAELGTICEICNIKILVPDEYKVKLAEKYFFEGGILQDVFDYHVNTACGNNYAPRCFVVITTLNWKTEGVLVIGLDANIEQVDGYATDDLECTVDSFFSEAEDVGLALASLQTQCMDWWEIKAENDLSRALPKAQKERANMDSLFQDGARKDRPFMCDVPRPGPSHEPTEGFYVAVYVLDGMDPISVIAQLEPEKHGKWPEDYIFRFEGHVPPEHRMEVANSLHPQRCTVNPYLHKQLFLVLDSLDPSKYGIQLVYFDWESHADLTIPFTAELAEHSTSRKVQRCEYNSKRIFRLIKALASGEKKWEDDHWCFQLFITAPMGWHTIVPLIDVERIHHEARVVVGASLRSEMPHASDEDLWTALINEIPRACFRKRFQKNYHRKLFICCDSPTPEVDGVLLIKAQWNADLVSLSAEEVSRIDISKNITAWRCPIKHAYKALEEIADGNRGSHS